MVKNSKETMVKDEQKVMNILQSNAKDSIDIIAKKCSFSRQKVWRIIKKVEKEKTIWGYSAIINEENIGMKHFIMLFKRTTQPANKNIIDEIAFKKLDDVFNDLTLRIESIYYVHGCYDGVISFWADNLVTAKKFINHFSIHMQGLIENIELLETIFPIRKQTIKNPHMEMLSNFL
jgi:DNA-binding Lrp family transcriptional regulator